MSDDTPTVNFDTYECQQCRAFWAPETAPNRCDCGGQLQHRWVDINDLWVCDYCNEVLSGFGGRCRADGQARCNPDADTFDEWNYRTVME